MLLDVQLQEKVEAVLASRLLQPYTAFNVLMATTMGITATLNVHHLKKVSIQGIIKFGVIAEVKAFKDLRKKLEGVLNVAEKIASLEMNNVTESTRQFVIKYVNKVNQCFLLHYNENVDVFLTCYPKLKHTTFKCTCKE